jgi:uncharacterized Fe-S cluster-containing MiaB family protein
MVGNINPTQKQMTIVSPRQKMRQRMKATERVHVALKPPLIQISPAMRPMILTAQYDAAAVTPPTISMKTLPIRTAM